LVAEFLKAGSYLRNWSPQTIETYKKGLDDFARTHSTLTKAELEKWVVEMRSRGMSPGGVNVHIRTMNSFLSYLREDGLDVSKPLKLLKATLTVKTLLSVEDVQKLVKVQASRENRTPDLDARSPPARHRHPNQRGPHAYSSEG
jgi:site-specific recombinase XerD